MNCGGRLRTTPRKSLMCRALFSMAMHIIKYRISLYKALYKEEKFFDYLRDRMYN